METELCDKLLNLRWNVCDRPIRKSSTMKTLSKLLSQTFPDVLAPLRSSQMSLLL